MEYHCDDVKKWKRCIKFSKLCKIKTIAEYTLYQCFFSKKNVKGYSQFDSRKSPFYSTNQKKQMQSMDKIHKMFRGTHTPAHPQEKSTALY
jgi:hypothetical protein